MAGGPSIKPTQVEFFNTNPTNYQPTMSDINKTNTKDGKPAFHLTLTQFTSAATCWKADLVTLVL